MSKDNKNNAGFQLFDHTADIGTTVFGPNLSDIFEQAARSMFSIIFFDKIPEVELKGEYNIELQSSDLEQLMVDWLDEILFIYSTEHIVISDYKIKIDPKKFTLKSNIIGQVISDEQLRATCEIKAVTYHMLKIEKNNNIWEAKVLFDI